MRNPDAQFHPHDVTPYNFFFASLPHINGLPEPIFFEISFSLTPKRGSPIANFSCHQMEKANNENFENSFGLQKHLRSLKNLRN